MNAINNIIGLPYTLTKTDKENIFKVSNKSNLFPILNHALIKNGVINPENKQGFNISLQEIQENLNNLGWNKHQIGISPYNNVKR